MSIRPLTGIIAICLVVSQLGGVTAQQLSTQYPQIAISESQALAVQAYWTPARMASAVPMTPPERLVEHLPSQQSLPVIVGNPGFVSGFRPGEDPQGQQTQTFSRSELASQSFPQAFGVPPSNPQSGPYGPFQRWSMQGAYLIWPRSIHGKLFFSLGGGNFVCSATVIGVSTIATAGHCVNDGAGTWGSNFLFCPSYNQGGVNPSRGCWAWTQVFTSAAWSTTGDPDYDYACIVTPTTGTILASKIGNVTGAAGRAWNWVDVPEITFGYPQGAPFNGSIIQQTASVDWYNVDFFAGGQVSKVIGSDLTGGSSGGGWFLSWRHPNAEIPDTDGNSGTDPAGNLSTPVINGVNSHKRCAVNCNTPPTSTTGIFWQEMTSPPFLSTAAADESEDIFAACLAHPNNSFGSSGAATAGTAPLKR